MLEEGQILETHYVGVADADVVESRGFYVPEILP